MSKLARITQKLFGSGAGTDQISKFGSLFAGAPAFTTDPAEAQSLSNWLTGWAGAAIGGNAPAIEDMNAIGFVLAYQLAYLFQAGIAEWDSGTTYYIGSFASVAGVTYVSQSNGNIAHDPTTDPVNWIAQSSDPVGTGKDYWGSTLPAGYVWASGKTIGNASSNATERANADTLNLFTLLWTNYANSILPIYDSTGTPTTRGLSASADFAANKALAIIDKRGRVSVGKDNLGGTAASRMTATTMAPDGTTLGASGGEQTHTLVTGEMPAHTHTQNPHTHDVGQQTISQVAGAGATYNASSFAGTQFVSSSTTAVNQNTGGDGAHNNVQPSIACNYILKL